MARIQWQEALGMERDVAILLQKQAKKGIYFDQGKARYFLSLLESKKEEEYYQIRPYLDYEVINEESKNPDYSLEDPNSYPFNFVSKIRLKNGAYNKSVISHFDDPSIVSGPFSRIEIEEPSISKRQLVVSQLLKHGWEPKEFTEKGFPQLTVEGEPVESLEKVGPFGKALANWYIYKHRQGQIAGFLKHVRPDSRIPSIMTGLTNTFRHKHKIVANIPRPTSVFGKEMRSLFTVPEDKAFVGADVAGLELRILAHWMDDEEYIHQILNGDIHEFNRVKAGLPTRDDAKTFIYAFLYGAGDGKIGSIIGGSAREGKVLREDFFSSIPSLRRLVDKVQKFVHKYGFIPSVDNRKIIIRSFEGKPLVYTALNAKLQADGSIVTKRSILISEEEVNKRCYDAPMIIFYHDEQNRESSPEIAEEVGTIMVDSMRLAGEFYKLRIPITGEYKVGKSWAIH